MLIDFQGASSLLATLGKEKYDDLMHLVVKRAAMIATGS